MFEFRVLVLLIYASVVIGQCLKANEMDQNKSKQITNWEARLEYAKLLTNLKRYDESLIQYHKLLDEKPGSIEIRLDIAQVLYYQGKPKEALELLEKIPPKHMNDKTLLMMAEIYVSIKEYAKGESILREELKKMPDNNWIKFKLAELLSWQKRYPESIQLYEQIVNSAPEDIQVRRKYAMVLMWMGEESKAAEELEKTLHE